MPETLFEIVVILLLIVINGLSAMSEITVVSARLIRLQQMVLRGNRGAAVALQLVDSANRILSTVQIGVTVLGSFGSAFGGANIAGQLTMALAELSWVGRYAGAISLALVFGTITFLSVVLGVLVPKRIALGHDRCLGIQKLQLQPVCSQPRTTTSRPGLLQVNPM